MVVSCIEKYEPDLDDQYEQLLVVDGMITNKSGPYTIKLSHTTNVYLTQHKPYSGCHVVLQDNTGEQETLTETEEGTYQTNINGIRGIVGRKYKITINTPEGQSYESVFQELLKPTEIEQVYTEIEYQEVFGLHYDYAGYQFYVDTKPTPQDTTYLLWKLFQTYKYKADYNIDHYWTARRLWLFPKPDSLRTCWKTETVPHFYTFNTQYLEERILERFPLHYVTTQTRELSVRYSLLTQQLTVNKLAYEYWNNYEDQIIDDVNLNIKQPFQLKGNLFNVDNYDEHVLGYFLVAGLSEDRIYVNKPDYPIEMRHPVCKITEADIQRMEILWHSVSNEWPLFITLIKNGPYTGALAYPHSLCTDCRERGGTLEQPDFWIDI